MQKAAEEKRRQDDKQRAPINMAPDSTIIRNMNALADNIANIEKQMGNKPAVLPGPQFDKPPAEPQRDVKMDKGDRLKQEKEHEKQMR